MVSFLRCYLEHKSFFFALSPREWPPVCIRQDFNSCLNCKSKTKIKISQLEKIYTFLESEVISFNKNQNFKLFQRRCSRLEDRKLLEYRVQQPYFNLLPLLPPPNLNSISLSTFSIFLYFHHNKTPFHNF